MASTSKCEYCGGTVRSDQQQCPNCGAGNPLYVVDTPRTIFRPKTIEELQEYCAERGMPLLRMRFFIGQDYKKPKAFGIFRDADGKVTVYKNKANGERSIRYTGYDEAKGVQELFAKLLDECHNRGIYPDLAVDGSPKTSGPKKSHKITSTVASTAASKSIRFLFLFSLLGFIGVVGIMFGPSWLSLFIHPAAGIVGLIITNGIGIWFIRKLWKAFDDSKQNQQNQLGIKIILAGIVLTFTLLIPGLGVASGFKHYNHPEGYYHYNDATYYKIDDSWYKYDDHSHSWYSDNSGGSEIYDSGRDYYSGYGWDSDWDDDEYEFKNSDAYESYQEYHRSTYNTDGSSSSHDYDSSSYDSWDSGGTDWDSDW